MAGSTVLQPINTNRIASSATKSGDEEPLSPSARLFHAPQFNCFIIAIVGCKTLIDVEVIKEGVKHTLIKHPRFSSKLVFDAKESNKPVAWVRTKVIVDDHLIVPNLPDLDPNPESGDRVLNDYVTKVTTSPMDLTKPLWEIHLLNIKTSDANGIGFFRIHHSIGDGVALMSLVLACTRQSANPQALPTLPTEKKKKKLKRPSSSYALMSWFLALVFMFRLLWNTLVDLLQFTVTTFGLTDTDTPLKGGPGSGKAPKRFVYRTFSLDDVKLVKKAMGVTINDVLLGITQAGLTHYLNRKYGEAKGKGDLQGNNLPKHIRLRSSVLINLRPTSTLENLAEQMESENKNRREWGNAIGYVMLPFHIGLKDDPLDYIRDAKATIDKKKHSLEAACTYATAKIILKTLGRRVVAAMTCRVLENVTLSFSNMVGPQEEISFYGHPMAFLAPSVYGHPQALTIHFQSYLDQMTLVLAVDPEVISDPQKLCDDVGESLRLAKKAVIDNEVHNS